MLFYSILSPWDTDAETERIVSLLEMMVAMPVHDKMGGKQDEVGRILRLQIDLICKEGKIGGSKFGTETLRLWCKILANPHTELEQ